MNNAAAGPELNYADTRPLGGLVRVFADARRLLEHLCDHVLTAPESWFWTVILPSFGPPAFRPRDEADMLRAARQVWGDSLPDDICLLLGEYGEASRVAVVAAIGRGWFWRELPRGGGSAAWHGIDHRGVYAIWDTNCVRTVMLLPFASPLPVRSAEGSPAADRVRNPLPRQGLWRERGHERVRPPRRGPQAEYDLFRQCWRAVRLERGRACSEGRAESDLPDLPPYQQWLALSSERPQAEANP